MVREFELSKDYETVYRWWVLHEQNPIPEDALPTYGLIDQEVAAGFLLVTDSTVGFLDFYVSNPQSNPKDRGRVLNMITQGLIEQSRKMGIKYLHCSSALPAVKNRAMKHGFEYIGEFSFFSRSE